MKFSIVITCDCNRSIRPALSALADACVEQMAEIVVVLFGLDERTLGSNSDIVTHGLTITNHPFNKALGINLGVQLTSSSAFFLMDADVSVDARTLAMGLRNISDNRSYATIRKVRSINMKTPSREERHVCKLVFPGAKSLQVTTSRTYSDGSRSGPGLVFVAREHFLGVGGMNSELKGWGWEDIDLLVRLEMKLGLRRRYIGTALHVSPNRPYSLTELRERATSERANMYRALVRYQQMSFDGTLATDVAAAARGEIQLEAFR
jgi:hypothetical protein